MKAQAVLISAGQESAVQVAWGLSNFSPPGFAVDGVFWPTVEHYFQAQKFPEAEARERIRRAATPKEARALGQSRTFAIAPEWNDIREEVMLNGLRCKFQIPQARELLLSTGARPLVESSPYDHFWACGQDGSGQNRLGHLLMLVRQELVRLMPNISLEPTTADTSADAAQLRR